MARDLSPALKHVACRLMWTELRKQLIVLEERSRVQARPFKPMMVGYHSGILEAIDLMDRIDSAAERELVRMVDRLNAEASRQ